MAMRVLLLLVVLIAAACGKITPLASLDAGDAPGPDTRGAGDAPPLDVQFAGDARQDLAGAPGSGGAGGGSGSGGAGGCTPAVVGGHVCDCGGTCAPCPISTMPYTACSADNVIEQGCTLNGVTPYVGCRLGCSDERLHPPDCAGGDPRLGPVGELLHYCAPACPGDGGPR